MYRNQNILYLFVPSCIHIRIYPHICTILVSVLAKWSNLVINQIPCDRCVDAGLELKSAGR